MQTVVRSLILLALVLWVGGLLFFVIAVAPIAFTFLLAQAPDPVLGVHLAGTMVRGSLIRLHDVGLVCGVVMVFLYIMERVTHMTRRPIGPQLLLLAVMVGLTSYSQFSILPRMDGLRAQAGPALDDPTATNVAKVDFNRLHQLSTRMEGIVLLCGLGLIVLYARPEPAA